MRDKTRSLSLLLLCLGAAWVLYSAGPSLVSIVLMKLQGSHGDDTTLFCGAQMLRAGLGDLYTPGNFERFIAGTPLGNEITGHVNLVPITYPPFFYMILGPLVWLLSITPFIQVWFLGNCVCLAATAFFLRGCLPSPVPKGTALGILAVVFVFCPTVENLFQGQPNILVVCLLSGTLYADVRNRPNWAATLLALATWVKVFPVLLVGYFVSRKDWRALRAFVVAMLAVGLITLVFAGTVSMVSYLTVGIPRVGGVLAKFGFPYNRTLDGLLNTYHRRSWLWLLKLVKAALVLATFAVSWRRRGAWGQCLSFCLWLTTALLIMPSAWQYYDIYYLPPVVLGAGAVLWGPARRLELRLAFGLSWVFLASADTRILVPYEGREMLNTLRIAVIESPWAMASKPLLFALMAAVCLRVASDASEESG